MHCWRECTLLFGVFGGVDGGFSNGFGAVGVGDIRGSKAQQVADGGAKGAATPANDAVG